MDANFNMKKSLANKAILSLTIGNYIDTEVKLVDYVVFNHVVSYRISIL